MPFEEQGDLFAVAPKGVSFHSPQMTQPTEWVFIHPKWPSLLNDPAYCMTQPTEWVYVMALCINDRLYRVKQFNIKEEVLGYVNDLQDSCMYTVQLNMWVIFFHIRMQSLSSN